MGMPIAKIVFYLRKAHHLVYGKWILDTYQIIAIPYFYREFCYPLIIQQLSSNNESYYLPRGSLTTEY